MAGVHAEKRRSGERRGGQHRRSPATAAFRELGLLPVAPLRPDASRRRHETRRAGAKQYLKLWIFCCHLVAFYVHLNLFSEFAIPIHK